MKNLKLMMMTLMMCFMSVLTSCGLSDREIAHVELNKIVEQKNGLTTTFSTVTSSLVRNLTNQQRIVGLGDNSDAKKLLIDFKKEELILKSQLDSITTVLDSLSIQFNTLITKIEVLPK